uniref:Uncharacterized protein n=1 Tax=Setaria digitata TaxID=48799 RepID=A0A915PLM2_9BILA
MSIERFQCSEGQREDNKSQGGHRSMKMNRRHHNGYGYVCICSIGIDESSDSKHNGSIARWRFLPARSDGQCNDWFIVSSCRLFMPCHHLRKSSQPPGPCGIELQRLEY